MLKILSFGVLAILLGALLIDFTTAFVTGSFLCILGIIALLFSTLLEEYINE